MSRSAALLVLAFAARSYAASPYCFYLEPGGAAKPIACPEAAHYADKLPTIPRGLVWRSLGERKYQPEVLLRWFPPSPAAVPSAAKTALELPGGFVPDQGRLEPEDPEADPYQVPPIEIRPDGAAGPVEIRAAPASAAEHRAPRRADLAPPPAPSEPSRSGPAAVGVEEPAFSAPVLRPQMPPGLPFLIALLVLVAGVAGMAAGYFLALKTRPSPARYASVDLTSAGPPPQPKPAASPESPPPTSGPLPPLLKGRFQMGRKVGIGGMGVVYDGFDRSLGRRVAIKQLRSELKDNPIERDGFLSEARIIAHLSHPYIVGFHDLVEENGEIYLVFDYIDGKPLSQILAERRRLPLDETQRIFSYVCEAMSCAHKNHVLHRDLKPSNIMVDQDGYAKVMDFGIAREAKESITRLTQGETVGTPAYMAPEQHMGRSGRASDIYSLGVCLYEALTGQLPFPGPDYLAQKERMKYPAPQYFNPLLPKETELLFAATLALDPRRRVGDAAELAESLKGLRV